MMKPGDQIRSIAELRQAAHERRSVIAPWYSAGEPKPHPAAFALNFNAVYLDRMLRMGLFVYAPGIKYPPPHAPRLPAINWQSRYENEVEKRLVAEAELVKWKYDYMPKALRKLAAAFDRYINLHSDGLQGYLIETAQQDAGLI